MSLQQEVLDSIGPGGIDKGRLREKVGNIGQAELDQTVNLLMRSGRLRLVFGRYEVASSAVKGAAVGKDCGSLPPTAQEELAANIRPAMRVCQDCQDCQDEKELEKEFSRSNLGTGYLKTCKKCIGKRAHAGKVGSSAAVAAGTPPAIKVSAPIPKPPRPAPSPDPVCESAKARRQSALNKIAMLEVELANQSAIVTRCDEFLTLHAEFAEGTI